MYAMVSVWQVENGKLADHEQALHQRIVPGREPCARVRSRLLYRRRRDQHRPRA